MSDKLTSFAGAALVVGVLLYGFVDAKPASTPYNLIQTWEDGRVTYASASSRESCEIARQADLRGRLPEPSGFEGLVTVTTECRKE